MQEKENLVIVRSLIPTKIQLYHQILTQLDALDSGEEDLTAWCKSANQVSVCSIFCDEEYSVAD